MDLTRERVRTRRTSKTSHIPKADALNVCASITKSVSAIDRYESSNWRRAESQIATTAGCFSFRSDEIAKK